MRVRGVTGSGLAVSLLLGIGSPAGALVNAGDARALGVVMALDGFAAPNGPFILEVPDVSVSSPPPDTQSQTLVDLAEPFALVPLFGGGVASVSASTNVDGITLGPRTAQASSTIDDFALVLSNPFGVPTGDILEISGDFSSTATVSGDVGSLNYSGSSTFNLAQIIFLGTTVFTLDPTYPPNTVIFDEPPVPIGGDRIIIIANEQTVTGDSSSLRTLSTNALHIYLTNLVGNEGQIILGHSEASLSAIPEPGTAALLGLGLAALARFRRRR